MSKFELGTVVCTAAIGNDITTDKDFAEFVKDSFNNRYILGDWGDLCKEDAEMNDKAIKDGERIMGAYKKDDITIWIITEADRSVTTILYPHEY